MPRISGKNQVTIPVAALEEAGLHAGDEVLVEVLNEGELRVTRGVQTFEEAFGSMSGMYPPGYLDALDAEDAER
jgi:antitoxin component of MazEF toxin-antitoxin module